MNSVEVESDVHQVQERIRELLLVTEFRWLSASGINSVAFRVAGCGVFSK